MARGHPRPAPSPDSPAAQAAASISVSGSETEIAGPAVSVSTAETEIGDPLAAVEAALERQGAALDREPPDWDAAHAAGAEAVVAGSVLRDDGQIASPAALCRALQAPRSVYQRVIAQYADGGPRASATGPGGWRAATSASRVRPLVKRCCAPWWRRATHDSAAASSLMPRRQS